MLVLGVCLMQILPCVELTPMEVEQVTNAAGELQPRQPLSTDAYTQLLTDGAASWQQYVQSSSAEQPAQLVEQALPSEASAGGTAAAGRVLTAAQAAPAAALDALAESHQAPSTAEAAVNQYSMQVQGRGRGRPGRVRTTFYRARSGSPVGNSHIRGSKHAADSRTNHKSRSRSRSRSRGRASGHRASPVTERSKQYGLSRGYSSNLSPTGGRSNGPSPVGRHWYSRSPAGRSSRSRSPPHRSSRSRSPPGRSSRGRSFTHTLSLSTACKRQLE